MEDEEIMKPVGTKVLLLYPDGLVNEGGVLINAGSSRRMDALVAATGNRVTAVSTGDTVIADRLNGIPVVYCGVTYRLIDESDVLARVEM